jgi:hypothetical protein
MLGDDGCPPEGDEMTGTGTLPENCPEEERRRNRE